MRIISLCFAFFWAFSCVSYAQKKGTEKGELEKIKDENALSREKMNKKIFPLKSKTEELKAEYELKMQENKNRTAELEIKLKNLKLENDLLKEKFRKELAELKQENEKLKIKNDRAIQEIKLKNTAENEKIRAEKQKISLELDKLRLEKEKLSARLSILKTKLEYRAKEENWKDLVEKDPSYLEEPYKDGKLVISDRRISLNGPIVSGVADYVSERINYYNNKSGELPIFLVIDKSPGGSVMEGYRIVKAIQASKAPVYVVVKSYAASMAAVITTLAKHSFAYPNALILHHQMSTISWGNITQLEEQLKMSKEWERRLLVPVAKKMGISLKEFKKRMYKNNSDGNWEEFADNAVKYKWVDRIVDEIRETGILKNPDRYKFKTKPADFAEKTDKSGKRYVKLPRLDPFDFYYIYNPDKYYR